MLALLLSLTIASSAQDPAPGVQDPPPPAAPRPASGESAVATLQGCAMEGERWVCRYQMPEIRVVEQPPRSLSVQPATAHVGAPADVGVLSEADRALVTRCADAGWWSLCLPGDRRRARELKDAAAAYDARRRDVAGLLAEGRCEAAVNAALQAGHLNLAREARAFCGR